MCRRVSTDRQVGESTEPPRSRSRFVTDEQGLAAGAEALIFGVLVFVIGTIIILNAWSVVDAKFATSSAAREAVRAAVEAPPGADLDATAETAAAAAFEGYGRDPTKVSVLWDGTGSGAVQARCAPVQYRVTTTVGVMMVPRLSNRLTFDVSSVYSELIDPFRSGLQESACDF